MDKEVNINSTVRVGLKSLPNRIIIPPIVRCKATSEGFVTDELIKDYIKHINSGASMLIIEASTVMKNGRILPGELGIFSDDHIHGLKKLRDALREEKPNVPVLIQLVHAGRMSCDFDDIVAPSPIPFENRKTPRELTTEEVYEIKDAFVAASERAIKAGFDGVEIHCAHGYLLSQFMSPLSNKRVDEFGGSIYKRAELQIRIIRDIRHSFQGKGKIISVRLGAKDAGFSGGMKLVEGKLMALLYQKSGADMINMSLNIIASKLGGSRPKEDMAFINYSKEISEVLNVPIAVAGGIRKKEHAEKIINEGFADIVAVCRAALSDPQFPAKVLGENPDPIIPCIVCNVCVHYKSGCPER